MDIEISKVKIVVFVPTNYIDKMREVICDAGAGTIGNYRYCTSLTNTIGTFIPNKNAKPYIGKAGKLEVVEEGKLEVICDINDAKKVISEIKKNHPYEEPGIDIIPLIDVENL